MAEVAGLVLGAFPLLVEGLKVCINGARTIGDIMHHDLVLEEFCMDIEMEQTKFHDICLQLLELEDKTSLSNSVLTELMGNAGSLRWQGPEVQIALERRIPQSYYPLFVRAVTELLAILQQLQKEFMPKRNRADTKFRMKSLQKFLGKLDFSLNEGYRAQRVARIRQLNADIRILVCGRMQINNSPVLICPGGNPASHYGRIKTHAVSLYSTMKEKFQDRACACKDLDPHSAALRLEMRTPQARNSTYPPHTRFQVLFLRSTTLNPNPYDWQQLELETLESADHPQHRIELNCQHLQANKNLHAEGGFTPPITVDFDIDGSGHTAMPQGSPPAIFIPDSTSAKPRDTNIVSALRVKVRGTIDTAGRYLRGRDGAISRSTSPAPETRLDSLSAQDIYRTGGHGSFTYAPENDIGRMTPVLRSAEDTCGLITCLCSTINAPFPDMNTTPPGHNCLGILVNRQADRRYRLRLMTKQSIKLRSNEPVSLATILNCPKDWPTPTLAERLRLGVNITSALMQLHESSWLKQSWGNSDIFFLQGPHGPVLEQPLVHRVFRREASSEPMQCTTGSRSPAASEWSFPLCNRSLFCLGVILIELWHWKPLSVLRTELGGGQAVECTGCLLEFVTAQCLAKQLMSAAGTPYGTPVQLCLTGLGHPQTQLEHEGFKNEVYKRIVYPLEENLRYFWGVTDLAEIYQE